MQVISGPPVRRLLSFIRESSTSHLRVYDLDKKDTTVLKAVAILAIVFHNFFHVAVNVRENEFDFNPDRWRVFIRTLVYPEFAIQALFAFYGHYGVQIFIFLSAFGLAKTYWDSPPSWHAFMWSRVKKLYPMCILAIVFWALLVLIHSGSFATLWNSAARISLILAGVSNIFPNLGLPPVGPWWFIPFIVQTYALFPLLRGITRRFGWPALVVFSLGCYYITHLANPTLAHWSINLSMTPIGRMRVLCLGIIAARCPFHVRSYVALPAFAVLILGGKYSSISHFCSISAVFAGLWVYGKLRPILRNSKALEKVGKYSLAIFLINGIVRVPFLYFAHTPTTQLLLGTASAAVTIAISSFFHYLLTPSPKPEPALTARPSWAPAATGSD